ncbi:MAG: outer membrane protein transport protein [Verrucomicrobiota bacterium]
MRTQYSVLHIAKSPLTRRGGLRPDCMIALLTVAVLALIPLKVFGLGSRTPNQDAAAIARGNAFVATADNPSAIYYNPAGISQLEGHNAQVGSLFYLNIQADYESPSGQRTENDSEIIPIPQMHYVYSPTNQPFSFGLGVYSPFGLGLKWPDAAPFRSAGVEVKLTYITINPVVAWQPHPTVSIAAGPTFNYSKAKLRQGVAVSPYQFRFEGDDWAYGFDSGILWQPHPQWSFGAKYSSATTLDYDGKGSFAPAAPFLPKASRTKTHLDFPQIAVAGVSFRPTTNWNMEVNVDWSDWDKVDNAVIDGIASLPLNWHSSFFYEFGVTRQLGKGYFLSMGYFFSEASTSDTDYTPLVPDTDLHVGSLGIGHHGQRWNWALAGQIIGGGFHKVDEAKNPSVNGKYRLFVPTISFSVGCHF